MAPRIFLATGATSGIGKHTAALLAKTGASVLVHGRSPSRVAAAVEELKLSSGNQNIKGYIADMSSLVEVRKLADELHATQTHIDVLINNAGVFETERLESADGFEMTFAVNVLAPFLLTSLLLDLLKAGHKSRIINVSSISHLDARSLDMDDLQLTNGYGNGRKAYGQSKLCEIMFNLEMADRLKAHNITANCLDPGTVNTQMLLKSWGKIGIPVEKADDEFHLACDEEFENVTGKYFVNLKQTEASHLAYKQKLREKLWDCLIKMTQAKFE
ncbi:polyprenol dehydrogenase-like [Diadema antillarum]|uniref:polyprenol dehydrogenase-like n=1 Tax=Diadema antillarum TaxID=105358 RepID=UPI003A8778C2